MFLLLRSVAMGSVAMVCYYALGCQGLLLWSIGIVCLDVTLLICTGREERGKVWVFLLVRTKGGRLGVLSSFLP
jgi:hypothetical protein